MTTKTPLVETIYIASDHAGFSLKKKLIQEYGALPWKDLGPFNDDSVDYPDFADRLAVELKKESERGILICGSGQGMAMRANKYPHIRAALCWNEESAYLAREHNDANVLCLAGRLLDHELCEKIFSIFLQTPFAGGRHQRRVDKLKV